MEELNAFVNRNAEYIAVSLGAAAVTVGLLWTPLQEFFRGLAMKQERRKQIHLLLAQGFTDFLIDKRISGELTLEEAQEEGFLCLKRAYPTCKEFYPIESLLKERIAARMKLGKHDADLLVVPLGKRHNMFTIGK